MIEINTVTWDRNALGLFDFESNKKSTQKILTNEDSKIARQGSNISLQGAYDDQEVEQLANVYKQENDFYVSFQPMQIKNDVLQQSKIPAFLCVRSLKNPDGTSKGYKIKLGDVITFGKAQYLVKEICMNGQSQGLSKVTNATQAQDVESECRICIDNTQTEQNPLIQVCQCRGSVEYIHLDCLRKWMSCKIKQARNKNVASYKWKGMFCELCTGEFKFMINLNGTNIPVVRFPKPSQSYICLQGISQDNEGLNFINLKENEKILIGRGHDVDFQINDITVSRLHAWIGLDGNDIMLHDSNSKFGTLVKLQAPVKIQKSQLVIQVGRTILSFALKN